jgi:enamine deaminase RidA (YjgF/YER057c/UK114 family)
MGRAGGAPEDAVRARLYVTDAALAEPVARAFARNLGGARPASTLVAVSGLARPEQLVEIELDAVDGARRAARRVSSGRPTEAEFGYSRAVRLGDRVWVSGTTALGADGAVHAPGDMYRQTRLTLDTILAALAEAGAAREDLVYTKTYVTRLDAGADYTRAWLEALGDVRPVSTLLGIPALLRPEMLIEVEAEAVIGAGRRRRDVYTAQRREHPRGYARLVEAGDWIHVSGCTAMDDAGQPRAPGDWARQVDLAHETIGWALGQVGASFDDVVRRRTFTVDGATVNRAHGEGPAWYARSYPSSLGCRISGLARPELLVEVEVTAVKSAAQSIEWLPPDPVDALDREPG